MSIYQVKHKARGRYGVITPEGQWLEGFLASKEEALVYTEQLNLALPQADQLTHDPMIKPLLQSFVLTDKGWLQQGES